MARSAATTPLMRQYLEIKQRYPRAILFFRLGDFYEMFYEDALVAAQALNLTLTTRDKNKDDPAPMCGVPHHAAKGYVRKLLEQGHKVAICEQVEDPKTARGVVKREVTEVVTPGVVLDSDQLDAKSNNFLAAIVRDSGTLGLAALDLSTFELRLTYLEHRDALTDELARLRPKEVIYSSDLAGELAGLETIIGGAWSAVEGAELSVEAAERLVAEKGDGALGPSEITTALPALRAAAAALRYAEDTQPGRALPRCRLVLYRAGDYLQLDEATLSNLEVFESRAERSRNGSLLGVLDATLTAMGGRLLRRAIAMPLVTVADIRRRQDGVEFFNELPQLRTRLQHCLREIADLERLTSRIVLKMATPREVARLGSSLAQLPEIYSALRTAADTTLACELPAVVQGPADLMEDIAARIQRELVDTPPTNTKDGGVFRRGVYPELDELVELAEGGKTSILQMESRLRERTAIGSLKIRYNRVFGYFIEVTRANVDRVPDDFKRKQTLVNAERFVTDELAEYEIKVLGAEERRAVLESQLFERLREAVAEHAGRLTKAAEHLARLDVLCALAEVAQRYDYVRPVVDESLSMELQQGRHPVVERCMSAGEFIPNDLRMAVEGSRMLVITGPNMAGKSTVIRQAALIVLMAQAGSFVPCRSARIGVVDRIFTRVGASDNLSRGESTFMVEMRETAAILKGATTRSLVVLDEVGRGTSTYDGISIAWAVAEYLHDRAKARTLFATHYHELCQLAQVRDHVANYAVAVQEWQGRVLFLHRLVEGSSSRSYGIEVARLAGLLRPVVDRARQVLSALEGQQQLPDLPLSGRVREAASGPQLCLLSEEERPSERQSPHQSTTVSEIEQELAVLDVQQMTPLDALNLLASLAERARA